MPTRLLRIPRSYGNVRTLFLFVSTKQFAGSGGSAEIGLVGRSRVLSGPANGAPACRTGRCSLVPGQPASGWPICRTAAAQRSGRQSASLRSLVQTQPAARRRPPPSLPPSCGACCGGGRCGRRNRRQSQRQAVRGVGNKEAQQAADPNLHSHAHPRTHRSGCIRSGSDLSAGSARMCR